MKKTIPAVLGFLLLILSLNAQPVPQVEREFRAVWIANKKPNSFAISN